jgi:hypothetical protein
VLPERGSTWTPAPTRIRRLSAVEVSFMVMIPLSEEKRALDLPKRIWPDTADADRAKVNARKYLEGQKAHVAR